MKPAPITIFASGCLLLIAASAGCRSDSSTPSTAAQPPAASQPVVERAFAGSAACVDCHKQQHDEWKTSHHALAQRHLDPKLDDPAFVPSRSITHASQNSRAEKQGDKYVLTTLSPDDAVKGFEPSGVLAVDPLWQYLIPMPGGR